MHAMLKDLGATNPVIAAPMAGGPSSADFVAAAGAAGSIAFLAAGYKSPQALAEQIASVRARSTPFGVNLFAPHPVPVDPNAFRRYAATIRPEFDAVGVEVPGAVVEDDDGWAEKVELLVADPVPLVSFTFGIPGADVIAALRARGTLLVQTVTTAAEARLAAAAGVDALAVQAAAAGGHSATMTPQHLPTATPIADLLAEVRAAVPLPLIAAGGLATRTRSPRCWPPAPSRPWSAPSCCAPTRAVRRRRTGPRSATPRATPCSPGPSPAARHERCATASPTATRTSPRPDTRRCTT